MREAKNVEVVGFAGGLNGNARAYLIQLETSFCTIPGIEPDTPHEVDGDHVRVRVRDQGFEGKAQVFSLETLRKIEVPITIKKKSTVSRSCCSLVPRETN